MFCQKKKNILSMYLSDFYLNCVRISSYSSKKMFLLIHTLLYHFSMNNIF